MLNWGFYYDEWLIDPLPKTLIVRVVHGKDGLELLPKDLRCYFGALPRYIYGESKFFHESFVSPTGIAVVAEFQDVINDDFIELSDIDIFMPKEYDFYGKLNVDKYFGYVDPSRYIKQIQDKIYSLPEDKYTNKVTPTQNLREATKSEITASISDPMEYQVYSNTQAMIDDGVIAYYKMDFTEHSKVPNELNSRFSYIHTDRAVTSQRMDYRSILDIKSSWLWCDIDTNVFNDKGMVIIFKTLPMMSFGKLFSFDDVEVGGKYYGLAFYIDSSSVTLYANDEESRSWSAPAIIDWTVSHKIKIVSTMTEASVIIDNIVVFREKVSSCAKFINTSSKIIAGKVIDDNTVPSGVGNIAELIICDKIPTVDNVNRFFDYDIPFIRSGELPTLDSLNNKPIFSYDLTYKDEHLIFIPNYLDEPIYKIHTTDISSEVSIIHEYRLEQNYKPEWIVEKDKVFSLPDNSRVTGMLVGTTDDYIQRDIKVFTKITSNTHYPIGIKIKFKIPEWFKTDTIYNFRLKIKPISRFLHYDFTKSRDEA
jgi:hypothetical protein